VHRAVEDRSLEIHHRGFEGPLIESPEALWNGVARGDQMTIAVSDLSTDTECAFADALQRIDAQPIDADPFPHIHVEEIFPPAYYRALLDRIATFGRFVPTQYPGVAVDLSAKTFRDFGLTCENFEGDAELFRLYAFLKSVVPSLKQRIDRRLAKYPHLRNAIRDVDW
jgi:hypothetical protein